MDLATALKLAQENLLPVFLRLAGAGAIWWIGRKAIAFAVDLVAKALTHNKLDPTLVRYMTSILSGMMTVFLVLGIVDFLGIPTTSFAALAAGAGLAIGAAWSGMLANFAAGIFLIVMRPFQVGDEISAGGVSGRVREIGLFATTIDTQDRIQTIVGNGRLFGENIQNHTAYAHRTCRVTFQLKAGTPFRDRMEPLRESIAKLAGAKGEAEVEFERYTHLGPLLAAQVECDRADFATVKADMADAIQKHFGDFGFGRKGPAGTVIVQAAGDDEPDQDDPDEDEEESDDEADG